MNYYTRKDNPEIPPVFTGQAPPMVRRQERDVTEKGKVEIWFIEPLQRMKGDDAFVCMMICFSLIEVMIRKELNIPDKDHVKFSENSPARDWFAKFLSISSQDAFLVWDAFRNGLIHRGMIKDTIGYELTGEKSERAASLKNGTLKVFVWTLRNLVVDHLKKHHRNLWRDSSSPLPGIYKRG